MPTWRAGRGTCGMPGHSGAQPGDPAGEPTHILITGANGFVGRHLLAHLLVGEDGGVPETEPAASCDTPEEENASVRIVAAVHREPRDTTRYECGKAAGAKACVETVPLDVTNARAVQALVARVR